MADPFLLQIFAGNFTVFVLYSYNSTFYILFEKKILKMVNIGSKESRKNA